MVTASAPTSATLPQVIACLISNPPYKTLSTIPLFSPPNFPGSLTTLLIAHITTLELGDHLEFYVTLTGLLIITGFLDEENTYFLVLFESNF